MKNVLVILLVVMFSASVNAQESSKVYTGFIYHFTKYIKWPSNMQSGNFVIGVIGGDDIASELESLASSKKVGSRSIKIEKFSSAADMGSCHIVFVGNGKSSQMASVVSKAKSNSTLVVTESAGATEKGSVINFIPKDGKVRFELSLASAKSHGLVVSSDLSRLAIVVD